MARAATLAARAPTSLIGCCLLVAAAPMPLRAQGTGPPGWTLEATPFLWLSNVTGTSRVSGLDLPVRDSTLQVGGVVRVRAWRGHWGAATEIARTTVAGARPGGVTPPSFESFRLTLTSVELLGGFRVGRVPTTAAMELLAGARYVRHGWDVVSASLSPDRDRSSHTWLEPLAGARFVSLLGGPFGFSIRALAGGLGLGSDFAWEIDGELGLRLSPLARLVTRYRFAETDFGGPGRKYVWNGESQGWLFGLSFQP